LERRKKEEPGIQKIPKNRNHPQRIREFPKAQKRNPSKEELEAWDFGSQTSNSGSGQCGNTQPNFELHTER